MKEWSLLMYYDLAFFFLLAIMTNLSSAARCYKIVYLLYMHATEHNYKSSQLVPITIRSDLTGSHFKRAGPGQWGAYSENEMGLCLPWVCRVCMICWPALDSFLVLLTTWSICASLKFAMLQATANNKTKNKTTNTENLVCYSSLHLQTTFILSGSLELLLENHHMQLYLCSSKKWSSKVFIGGTHFLQ